MRIDHILTDIVAGSQFELLMSDVGIFALMLLAPVLVCREIIQVSEAPRLRRWALVLDAAIVPLSIIFALAVVIRLVSFFF